MEKSKSALWPMTIHNSHTSALRIEADGLVALEQRGSMFGLFCFQGVGPTHLKVEARDGFCGAEIRQAVVDAICATPIDERMHLLFPVNCTCCDDVIGYEHCLAHPATMGEVFPYWGMKVQVGSVTYYHDPDSIRLVVEPAAPISHIVHRRGCRVVLPPFVEFVPGERYVSFHYQR